MKDCIVLVGKRGLYDNAALALVKAFEGSDKDVVFLDESDICWGSGIKGYILASRYFPALSGLFLRKFLKKYKIKQKKRVRLPRVVRAREKCENVLYRFYPRAVVCFTPRSLSLFVAAKKRTGYAGAVVAGVFDFLPPAGMRVAGADFSLAPTKECAARLKGECLVTGMPVAAAKSEKEQARRQLGIKGEKPVLLVTGGRYCSGRAMRAAREFSAFSDVMQIVLSGGKKGANFVEKHCPQVIVAAEEDMDVLYAAADVAVIAPTAFIAAECLKRRLPTVMLPPVNKGQKLTFKALKEVCVPAKDSSSALKAAMELLMDKNILERTQKGAALLGESGEERLKAAVEEIVSRLKGKEVFAEQEEQPAEKEGKSEGGKEDESAGGEDARGE